MTLASYPRRRGDAPLGPALALPGTLGGKGGNSARRHHPSRLEGRADDPARPTITAGCSRSRSCSIFTGRLTDTSPLVSGSTFAWGGAGPARDSRGLRRVASAVPGLRVDAADEAGLLEQRAGTVEPAARPRSGLT